uniref:Uncharacterized protein n=1 Tax=Anguilla anguilla TaxID=7936 RepID=A0A0E9PBF2_ANGAN
MIKHYLFLCLKFEFNLEAGLYIFN